MNERTCEAVGIDLGTTYSSLAFVDRQGTPRVVADSNGQMVMPSVVFFDDDEIIVGEVALSQAKLRADQVVQFIKVHMGEPWRKEFNGKLHTPESLSALILGQLVREAEPQIGPIRKAVITVPAFFTEKRRRATQQAGEIAGLEVIGTLNEPMSAALAYGLHRTDREKLAVVYDLGGGTFDVTIVRITPNELEELATNGNRQLGGRDWDQMLADYVCDDFRQSTGVDPRQSPQALQDLLIECEKAKRRISKMQRTAIRLYALGHDHTTEITRAQFEDLTAHLVQATKLTTELVLEDARLRWQDIAQIVLVGGSTNMPAVRRMLQEVGGITPETAVNPVMAVALGAGIYAHMLETGTALKTFRKRDERPVPEAKRVLPKDSPRLPVAKRLKPPVLDGGGLLPTVKFVTAHGVGLRKRVEGMWVNDVLIPKNTRVPTRVTKRYVATGDANSARFIAIEITQGDTPRIELAETLGIGQIELPANERSGNPVDVTLEFDAQGRLHARAVYVRTGEAMSLRLNVPGSLRQAEVAAFRELLGFRRPFAVDEVIGAIEMHDNDDDDSIPLMPPL